MWPMIERMLFTILGALIAYVAQRSINDRIYNRNRKDEQERQKLSILADTTSNLYELQEIIHDSSVDLINLEKLRTNNSPLYNQFRERLLDYLEKKTEHTTLRKGLAVSSFQLRRLNNNTFYKRFEEISNVGRKLITVIIDASKDGCDLKQLHAKVNEFKIEVEQYISFCLSTVRKVD